MMSGNRLGNEWCYLRILPMYHTGSYISVMWPCFCQSLYIFLPLSLFFSLIMQKPHKPSAITHAKLCGKTFCPQGNASLVLFI